MNASGETRQRFPPHTPPSLRYQEKLAASTCAKRVKSRGEAGFPRMAIAIRGMPGSEFEPRRPLQKETPSERMVFSFWNLAAEVFVSDGLLSFLGEGGSSALRRGSLSLFASGGLFSFSSERKEEKKRRQKLRFWISLRGFTWFLSCQNKPRERCAAQISPKYCIVSASRSAAAFALKCRRTGFYRGRDQRQRRRRRDDPFDRTTKSNPRDRVGRATNNYQSIARRKS